MQVGIQISTPVFVLFKRFVALVLDYHGRAMKTAMTAEVLLALLAR